MLSLEEEKLINDRNWDAYFYPSTNVLKNKLNIYDYDELKEIEAEKSFERLVQIIQSPISGSFDKEHLKGIHAFLFQDLYDWAGEYRNVNMRKETDFVPYTQIDKLLDIELKQMHDEEIDIISKASLASHLTTYFVELMNIHPFREGNGRTVREFLRQYVYDLTSRLPFGPLELDWNRMDSQYMLDNIYFARVFRSGYEEQFFNGLVERDIDKNMKI